MRKKGRIAALLFVFWLLGGGLSGCAGAQAVAAQNGREVLILMYHSVLRDPAQIGKYVISPERLEQDLCFLRDRGYETVVTQDLIDYVQTGRPMPEKPVILTFDDGHYNNLVYVLPLLEKYDMRAVISVVGKYTEQFSGGEAQNPAYSYLSWADITALQESGRIEIQNHSYDMHESVGARRGAKRKAGESAEAYAKSFSADVYKLQLQLAHRCRVFPTAFTYPFGLISEGSEQALRQAGFLASYSCEERVNRITRDPACLWRLGRYNRDGRLTSEDFFVRIGVGKRK